MDKGNQLSTGKCPDYFAPGAREALRNRSSAERFSDALTKAVGSLTSIALHAGWFATWIAINIGLIPRLPPFDSFPFGILTLIVSTEGVLLALIILISQNRMIRQADRRAHLDLQISLLAEQESTLTLHTLLRIARHVGLPEDAERSAGQGACEADGRHGDDAYAQRATAGGLKGLRTNFAFTPDGIFIASRSRPCSQTN